MNRYRRLGRRDANEGPIIDALRGMGCSVLQLHEPADLLVSYRGLNLLVEVKDPAKSPSARKLTPDQVRFKAEWRGQYDVAYTPEDAIHIVKRHVWSGSRNNDDA